MTNQNDYERQLMLLLRRQMALENDHLMELARELVDQHFEGDVAKDNILKSSQLKKLEGVAYTSLNFSKVQQFINHQANKSQKAKNQTWSFQSLDKELTNKLKEIVGRMPGKTGSSQGIKDNIIEAVKEKAREVSIQSGVLDGWLDAHREQEIQMELLREFVSYFIVLYELKGTEKIGAADMMEEEG